MKLIPFIKEIFTDAFFEYRAPNSKGRVDDSEKKLKEIDKANFKEEELKSLFEISLARLDKMNEGRDISFQKSFQLMALNLALLYFIAQLFPDHFGSLCSGSQWVCVFALILMLFSGTKSVFHCLIAIHPKGINKIPPVSQDELSTNHNNIKHFYLKKLIEVGLCHDRNNPLNAIIAEHSALAASTTIAQVFFSTILLINIFLSVFNCATPDLCSSIKGF